MVVGVGNCFRRVLAPFSPEIVQALAVKWLITSRKANLSALRFIIKTPLNDRSCARFTGRMWAKQWLLKYLS